MNLTANINLSPHLSLTEATKSATAIRNGIDNTPDAEQLRNLKVWAEKIWEPVHRHFRDKYGKTPKLTSAFRCPQLNTAIGGSTTSQHCKGEAGDIDGDPVGIDNKEIFDFVVGNLDWDQAIFEFPDANNKPSWVHVSYRAAGGNRKMKLQAVKENGKTIYKNL